MAEMVASQRTRRETSRLRRRRDDLWISLTALVAAMLALPFAQSAWHGPEVAAVLAVAATAQLAGQRWPIAVIVLAELLLLPTVWPRAFLADGVMDAQRIAAMATLVAVVPGLLATKRASAALVLLLFGSRTRLVVRRVHLGIAASGLFAALLPLL